VIEEGDYSLASGMTGMRLFSYEIERFLAGARNDKVFLGSQGRRERAMPALSSPTFYVHYCHRMKRSGMRNLLD
jgi:hypothetical protein